jgi:hypothetical protein
MSHNLEVRYMTEQITRGRLDGTAARGWLAAEATASRPRTKRSDRLASVLGAAFIRLGGRLQGTARPAGASGHTVAPTR